MKKNHVFFVFSNLGLGGVQKRIVDLANFIASSPEENNTVAHILIKEVGEFSFIPYLKKSSRIKIHIAPKTPFKRGQNILFLGMILWKCFQYVPQSILVFLHFSLPALILIKLLFKKTRLVLSQDNILSYYNAKPHVNTVFSKKFIQLLYYFLDAVIVQTHYARRDLIQHFQISPKKIVVIPNWGPKELSNLNKKPSYDLIYAGRLARQKQLEKFIELVEYLKQQKNTISAIIFGEGPELDALNRLIRLKQLENNISIQPTTYSLEKELPKARFFCLTSLFEGHPMVVLEAMACGVVPAVLQFPGSDEYLHKDFDALLEQTIPDLGEKIITLLEDKNTYKKMSLQTKLSLQNTYNYEVLIKETLSLLA